MLRWLEGELQAVVQVTGWFDAIRYAPNTVRAASGCTAVAVGADDVVGRAARIIFLSRDRGAWRVGYHNRMRRAAIHPPSVVKEGGLVAHALCGVGVKVRVVEGIEEVHAEPQVVLLLEVPVLVQAQVTIYIV